MENATSLRAGNRAGGHRGHDAPARFTRRQLEVLALLCEGLSNKTICRRLNISAGTVKVHISNILRELGVDSRLQAVLEARRRGVLNQSEGRDARAFAHLPRSRGPLD